MSPHMGVWQETTGFARGAPSKNPVVTALQNDQIFSFHLIVIADVILEVVQLGPVFFNERDNRLRIIHPLEEKDELIDIDS